MGNWKLFIDDLRQPDEGFVLSTSVDDAISLIETQGFPVFISFDHDLGDNCKTGKEFVDLIINQVLDGKWVIPSNFEFQVHSDNPVGSENIRFLLNNFLKHININFSLQRTQPYSSRS